ncbi:MAG: hypothetical protein QOF76_3375 [Solirubrobacteraceae bacterium]|nr:hypothetical protein [Solirubrobacteraceae bacterium]
MTDISVIVATRNRPGDLSACLESLEAQRLAPREIVVVDDDPGGDLTPCVVAMHARRGPVSYVAGPRAGLAAAHNAALPHVTAPLIAFTDDDVVTDPAWLQHIHDAFADVPGAGCVTGRIEPLELDSPVQRMLESYARFDKGAERRVYDLGEDRPRNALFPFAAGSFGSGANMAFTRQALDDLGGFDPALGAGTRARGGDDLSAFFEVILHGHKLVYEPRALIRHRHARELPALKRQVYGYGVGLTAYLTKCLVDRPELALRALRGVPAAFRHIFSDASPKNAGLDPGYPPQLRRLERIGMLAGPFAYVASRRDVAVGRRERRTA